MSWRAALDPEHQALLRSLSPKFLPPMLATLAQHAPGDDWVLERKLDGYRIIAACTPQGARLFSRSGKDVTQRFPFTAGLPKRDCVLDGEAAAFQPDGTDSFEAVQQGEANALVLFDVLALDGDDVRDLPWHERRPLLDLIELTPPCARLPWTEVSGDDPFVGRAEDEEPPPQGAARILQNACAAGWEGLIAKRRDARYREGRGRAWLKLKCIKGQEFVIGGFTEPAGTRTGLGAILVGHYDNNGLRYAGKVGTGFDDATLKRLTLLLQELEVQQPAFEDPPRFDAHWVEPSLVARIDFTQWTRDGKLRHPRFLGLRDDKRPLEVVREA